MGNSRNSEAFTDLIKWSTLFSKKIFQKSKKPLVTLMEKNNVAATDFVQGCLKEMVVNKL